MVQINFSYSAVNSVVNKVYLHVGKIMSCYDYRSKQFDFSQYNYLRIYKNQLID